PVPPCPWPSLRSPVPANPPAPIAAAAIPPRRATPGRPRCGTALAPSPAPAAGTHPGVRLRHTSPNSGVTPDESSGPAPRPDAGGSPRRGAPATTDGSGNSALSDRREEYAGAAARPFLAGPGPATLPLHSPAASLTFPAPGPTRAARQTVSFRSRWSTGVRPGRPGP